MTPEDYVRHDGIALAERFTALRLVGLAVLIGRHRQQDELEAAGLRNDRRPPLANAGASPGSPP